MTSTTLHHDLSGAPIKPGDYLVYAASHFSRDPVLKYAQVVSLHERVDPWCDGTKVTPTIRVRAVDWTWEETWELQKKGQLISLSFCRRTLVVPSVPEAVRELLAGAAGHEAP